MTLTAGSDHEEDSNAIRCGTSGLKSLEFGSSGDQDAPLTQIKISGHPGIPSTHFGDNTRALAKTYWNISVSGHPKPQTKIEAIV